MLKQRHSDFNKKKISKCSGAIAELAVFFASGAAAMLLCLHTAECALLLSCGVYAVLFCAFILVESALLGGSFAGAVFQPFFSALFGAAVCLFSAVQKQGGNGSDIRSGAALAVMVPVFFAVSAEGLRFSSALWETGAAHRIGLSFRKKYILLLGVCAVIAAAALYSIY